jgi:hypothetical protein
MWDLERDRDVMVSYVDTVGGVCFFFRNPLKLAGAMPEVGGDGLFSVSNFDKPHKSRLDIFYYFSFSRTSFHVSNDDRITMYYKFQTKLLALLSLAGKLIFIPVVTEIVISRRRRSCESDD